MSRIAKTLDDFCREGRGAPPSCLKSHLLCAPRPSDSGRGILSVVRRRKESVAGPEHKLLYMPFLEWQKKILSERLELRDLPFDEELSVRPVPMN